MSVQLGDTVRAFDREFARPIEVQARVIAIEYDLLDIEGTAVVEIGQFLSVNQHTTDLNAETLDKERMHLGEKLGLIKSSNITDLADLDAVFRSALDPEANREEALKGVDTTKYLKVIYLSIMCL